MTKLVIECANNGWILKTIYKKDPDENKLEVFSYDDSSTSAEANAFAELLWAIKSVIGPQESRYSKERVMINIEPGDKYVDQSEESYG